MSRLVLTRKEGQKIMIGDEISVRVHRLGASQVEIEVVAPADVPVHRLEVWEEIRRRERGRMRPGRRPPSR